MSALPERLAALLVGMTPNRPEAFDALREMYTDDVVFRDPIQVVRGMHDFLAMNQRLLRRMRTLTWTVKGAAGDDQTAFLEWTMRGTTGFGVKVLIDGTSRVHARDGRVSDQRDYWDLGELVASTVPYGKRILHTLLSPLA